MNEFRCAWRAAIDANCDGAVSWDESCPALQPHRVWESSLSTIWWSESTFSSWWLGEPASRHGSLNFLFQTHNHRLTPHPTLVKRDFCSRKMSNVTRDRQLSPGLVFFRCRLSSSALVNIGLAMKSRRQQLRYTTTISAGSVHCTWSQRMFSWHPFLPTNLPAQQW